MYSNLFLIIFLSVAYTEAQDIDICECDSAKDVKQNENLWEFLKRLEKLANEVPEERRVDYAAVPGNLYQLGCNCEDKMRNKREAELKDEYPEEMEAEAVTVENVEEVREKRHVVLPFKFPRIDLRCPLGTYWLPYARTCVRLEKYDDSEELN